jgi:CBS domain-containing protein
MRPATEILTADMTIQDALEKARDSRLEALPLNNERGVAGIVKLATLEKAAADGDSNKKLTDLIEGEEFPHLHADQSLTVALERMGAAGVDALPVVSRADVHKLEGIVALQDVMKLYGFAAQNTPD